LGVHNLVIEVDAKYIKGMLANPDIAPSASINRWIISILMFQFDLVHIPGIFHGPDSLSRRRAQPADKEKPIDDSDDWVDQVHGFMHMICTPSSRRTGQIPSSVYVTEIANPIPSTKVLQEDIRMMMRTRLFHALMLRVRPMHAWHS
jgi:hypothetical protein